MAKEEGWKMQFLIEYGASKSKRGGFSVDIWVNGAYQWTTAHNTKTLEGGVKRAKRIAENHGDMWRKASRSNVVTVQPRNVTPVTPAIDEIELMLANREF